MQVYRSNTTVAALFLLFKVNLGQLTLLEKGIEIGYQSRNDAATDKLVDTDWLGVTPVHADKKWVAYNDEVVNTDWLGIHPVHSDKKWVAYNDTEDPWHDHPYSLRKPGDEPYHWFYKHSSFRHQQVPLDKRICFVHVGKTAGSTMGCMLGFKTPTCYHNPDLEIPDGDLPTLATNLFHNEVNDCYDDMAYYLMAVRNPLHRIQSWWTYEREREAESSNRHRRPLFRECPFETLNDMAEMGLAANGTASEVCKERAHLAIRGMKRYARHNFYNYQYYRQHIPADAKILVVRTEHLEHDWKSTEALLGSGVDLKPKFSGHVNTSPKSDADKYLSELSRKLLCQGLCYDIQVYKRILREALNLSQKDMRESMHDLEKTCQVEANLSKCPPKQTA